MRFFTRLLDWWNSLPLGYSELHVPAGWSKEQVREHIRTKFAHRLPTDPRARGMRIGMLVEDHCFWQKFTGTVDHRPAVPKVRCRR